MNATDQLPKLEHKSALVWLRLVRVFQKIDRREQDEFRCHKLTPAQFDVLAHVGASDGPTQQQLADSLLVTKGNVCQLLDRMEKAGILERRQEGRANRLFLTGQGKELYRRVVPGHECELEKYFSSLSREEQDQLLRLLRKLDKSLSP